MFSIRSNQLKRVMVVVITVLVLMTFAVPVMAGAKGTVLNTPLYGREEVPGPGDPDAFGMASIRLNPETSEVCWRLKVFNIAPATAAHIHVGPMGVAGPVVVPLSPPTNGLSTGCATADPALIMDIIANPTGYYVNVHNADFPAGALRGQLGD